MSYVSYVPYGKTRRELARNWQCDTCHSALSLGDMGHRSTIGSLKLSAARGCAECAVFLRGILQVNGDETDDTAVAVSASDRFPEAKICEKGATNIWGTSKRVTFYCTPRSSLPWQSIPTENHASGSTSVQSAVSFTKLRLEACSTTHGSCTAPGPTQLPKRTVFLGEDPHLVSVKENTNEMGTYTTLSYCWGDPKFHPIKTQKGSLAQHMQGITLNSLPKTFQEAIKFTKALGIHHIWIDSLCIIQDDKDDCAVECSKMSSIYTNSFLTISAAASEDTRGGLFRTNKMKTCEIRLPTNLAGKSRSSIFARPPMHSKNLQPIYKRGWIYQERLLSKRTLYFYEFELTWQCASEDVCECGHADATQPQPLKEWAAQPGPNKDLWGFTVRNYTKLELGWGADKLPAISGVADNYQARSEVDTGSSAGQFYAGLWERNLPEYMGWRVLDAYKLKPRPEYRAPTWSWASVDGEVVFPTIPFPTPNFMAEIVSVNCVLASPNRFGQVSDGWMDLKTFVCPGFLHFDTSSYRLSESRTPDRRGVYSGMPTVYLDVLNDHTPPMREITCAFLMYSNKSEPTYILLLEEVSTSANVFRRVGLALCPSSATSMEPLIKKFLHSFKATVIKII